MLDLRLAVLTRAVSTLGPLSAVCPLRTVCPLSSTRNTGPAAAATTVPGAPQPAREVPMVRSVPKMSVMPARMSMMTR